MTALIRDVHVQNFKSIDDLKLSLGRVNVLIGENGCGKSNLLEALAFASGASVDKLENEFLASRGVRVAEPSLMRSAFKIPQDNQIQIDITDSVDHGINITAFAFEDANFPTWMGRATVRSTDPKDAVTIGEEQVAGLVASLRKSPSLSSLTNWSDDRIQALATEVLTQQAVSRVVLPRHPLGAFVIYSPENSALRTFSREGQILPLGTKGEGLFRLLKVLSADTERWAELKRNLGMLQWFGGVEIPADQLSVEQTLRIKDRFLAEDLSLFDQRSANEGFLFLLFYFALVISSDTPPIFAIDNVDASLNPKVATGLTSRIASLAAKYDKQVVLTTHSPAVLDGLDLKDDEQRLFVLYRNKEGRTRCRRVFAPKPLGDETPVKLSEAFMRGLLGGLPQNF